jgi:hypothetical protein
MKVTHSSTRSGNAFGECEVITFSHYLAIQPCALTDNFFCFENDIFINGTWCPASYVNSVSNGNVPGVVQSMQ